MTENRSLAYGDRLPESWVNTIQEFIGTYSSPNFTLTNPSSTVVRVQAGTMNDQVAIAVEGRWRYISSMVNASHPGGVAGTYDIYVTASDNSFSGGEPETDSTVYAFGLAIVASGTFPGTALYRKVGTLTWSGSSITSVTQTVGVPSVSSTPTDLTARAGAATQVLIGATGGAASIAFGLAADAVILRDVGPKLTTGVVFNAAGFQVGGTALAASHLSNGVTGTGAVVLAGSPNLSGAPLAPTAATDDNSTKLATTAFVLGQAYGSTPAMNGVGATGSSTRWARGDHVHPSDTSRAALASPTFTGTPAAPTAAANTNTTQIATTAFVMNAVTTGTFTGATATRFEVTDTNANAPRFQWNVTDAATDTKMWDVVAGSTTLTGRTRTDGDAAGQNWIVVTRAGTTVSTVNFPNGTVQIGGSQVAVLASPTFTGTPAAPTAAVDTSSTQLATTAFVLAQAASATPIVDGTGTVGTSTRFARADHIHPTDTSRSALASPTFTGTPAAPTASTGTNTTQLATTAFVLAQIAATGIAVNTQSGTTYTAVLGDQDNLVTMSNTSPQTFTVPPHSSVAWTTGHALTVAQLNTGLVTIAAGAGVTLLANPGLKLFGQNAVATLLCIATDTWLVMGNISS